ncbi:hypothetical protein ABHQ57_08325 [Tenacibaculum sp. ZH5_bin.1]|uniref:hypothetical protein n=1 Tax=Tenacibaculum TaxID=104267 RepID=UPI001431A031|nr:hypothetical protein [Tenacibaculum mesophilum]KAF9658011.1 hypothetical protein HBA12_12405 [Tenacibaculum mesophilum]
MEDSKLISLSKEELLEVNGGGFFDYVESLVILNGYVTGRVLDNIHGLYDGLAGVDKH